MVLDIYQTCNTAAEFKKAFDKLDRRLNAKRDKKARELRTLLLTESSGAKEQSLDKTRTDINSYLKQVEYWENVDEPEVDGNLYYWTIDNWGEKTIGSHGTLFLGAFCNGSDLLFPVLLLCDEHGNYVDFTEKEMVKALENTDDSDIHYFTPVSYTHLDVYKRQMLMF